MPRRISGVLIQFGRVHLLDVVKKMTSNAGPNNLSNIYICNSDLGHIVNTPYQKKSFITSVIVIRDGR